MADAPLYRRGLRRYEPKACRHCGAEIERKAGISPAHYERRTYCSWACNNAARTRPPTDRLLEKVQVDPVTGCWEWRARRLVNGYGYFSYRGGALAHRASYELLVGPIPSGLQIMHACDNPSCVNPKHLTPGTQAENEADKIAKGRRPVGLVCNSELTEDQVRAIRSDLRTNAAVASAYGIKPKTVSGIRNYHSWRHVQ